jgi:hypothetical protein
MCMCMSRQKLSCLDQQEAMIDASVAEWMKHTCVVFEKRTSSSTIPATEQYVRFTTSSSGYVMIVAYSKYYSQ